MATTTCLTFTKMAAAGVAAGGARDATCLEPHTYLIPFFLFIRKYFLFRFALFTIFAHVCLLGHTSTFEKSMLQEKKCIHWQVLPNIVK